jgi:RNA polymerase sigma factor (sigma-70 family)
MTHPQIVRLSRTPTAHQSDHNRHRELCQLAKTGCRESADELTAAVWRWCHRTAYKYARQWGYDTVDPEEAAATALAKLPSAIETYDGSGKFTGWFFFIARRAILGYCQSAAAKKNRFPIAPEHELTENTPEHTSQRQNETITESRHLADALCLLTPLERIVYTARLGYPRVIAVSVLKKRHNLTELQIIRLHDDAHRIVVSYLRPRCDTL